MTARILLCTFGSLGDVHPYLALGLELKRRGHDPVIGTHPHFRAKVEALGLGFRPIGPEGPQGDEYLQMMHRLMDAWHGPELVVRMFMDAARPTYDDTLEAARGVDLVVTHPLTFTAIPAAEVLGLPWASTVLAPLSFLSAHDPPALPPMPALAKLRPLGPRFWRAFFRPAKRQVDSWVEPFHQLRNDLGLPAVRDPMFEGSHSPDLVLALFSRVFVDRQPDWPPHTVVTGFCFHDEGEGEEAERDRLDAFLDDGDPPVVFTLGSSAVWKAGDFYLQAMEAVRRLGRRAILLVGRDERNRPTGPLPPSVGVFSYAPFSGLFPRCAAIVHQGGVGTTAQALRSGRPMLVVPYAFDQFDNARCAERLGVARWVSRPRFTATRVARLLRDLLDDPGYAHRAGEIARAVASEDGPAAAAGALEALLSRRATAG